MTHAFECLEKYYLLDVETNAIHELDELAYQTAVCMENGRSFDDLIQKYGENAINEVVGELKSIRSPEITPVLKQYNGVKALCLHTAHDCDMRCRYCFAATGGFHGERTLMPLEVGKAASDFLMRNSTAQTVEVDFFGGEPLMNFETVKQCVAYGRELEKRYGRDINFTVTTNCLNLDDEKIDFIDREMFNVVLSLDGRPSVHDALRPDTHGRDTYRRVADNIKKLLRGRGDKSYYVRGTFTAGNLDFTEDVKHIHKLGIEQISVEPVVLPDASPYAIRKEHLPRIFDEYERLLQYYLDERVDGDWFEFFHFFLDLENGPCVSKRLSGCGAGCEYFAVTPNGDVYPCHQFVGEREFLMGNVSGGVLDEAIRERFTRNSVLNKPECVKCWCKYFCGGGCAANAYHAGGDICKPYSIGCEMQKKRVECALATIAAVK